MPKSVKKSEAPQGSRPARIAAAKAEGQRAVEVKKEERPGSPAAPAAEITLHASRRFWLITLAALLVVLGVIQGYGYLTGWGDPERVVQRRFNSAQRLTLARRYDAAVREYEKILKTKTGEDNRRQALIGIADLRREQKDWDRAVELYEQLRRQDPNNVLAAWAGLQIGDIRLESGQTDAASRMYAEVSQRFPKSDWDAESRLGQGKVLEKQEKYREAIAAYDGLVKDYPGGFLAAEALVHAGQCYELLDNVAAARRAYQTVLDSYPASTWDDAQQRLKRLDPGQTAQGIRVWGQGK